MAPLHLAEVDVPVGGLGRDPGMRLADRNLTVGRVHAKPAGHVAYPYVPIGVLDDTRPDDAAHMHGTRAGRDLGTVESSL